MSALVFMDTETTGLALTDDIWEFAGIRREEDGTLTELHLFIDHDKHKCDQLPPSFLADHKARWGTADSVSQEYAARAIDWFTRKAHIVGCVPNFDTERITLLLRRFGIKPQWHYHLIDVENLAVGFLAGRASQGDLDAGLAMPDLPWDSDALSAAIGIEPPTDARHTAMGDALWAMQIYDHVMGTAS
jgi:hypothetical protein